MGFSNDRANHSLEVAKQMYEKALEQTGDEFYARKIVRTVWTITIWLWQISMASGRQN